MARSVNLLITCILAGVICLASGPFANAASLGTCEKLSKWTGTCFSVDPDQRGVTGEATASNTKPAHPGKDVTPGRRRPAPRPLTPREAQAVVAETCTWNEGCGANRSPTGGPLRPLPRDPAEPDEPTRAVTIRDVAQFLPAAAALHAEPDGWAVVGVPANFWVDVAPVTVDGELLGEAAEVRFTPRAYRWEYGDGAIQTTTNPGATWAILDQEELTETATSHRYRERAIVRPAVTVLYAAEYRLADDAWIGIDGAVTDTAPPIRTLVVRERTALVDGGG